VGYRESGPTAHTSVPTDRSDVSVRPLLVEHNIKQTTITNLIKEPRKTLIKAIEDNDNIYYSKLALAEQDRNGVKLVDIPRNIVDNVRKKTHFGYQSVINKRKDLDGRKAKTESFLSELNKKK
jgi:hypothetical protein